MNLNSIVYLVATFANKSHFTAAILAFYINSNFAQAEKGTLVCP